jgi:uncharacterized YigZ family protein
MSQYRTIAGPSTGIYKEKNSKFLGFAYPVENETEIKEILIKLKKEYFDARHYCYAYRLGVDAALYRANDDGEPNHSAGDPILGQLKSADLTNILLVVVRYFGGVKLGVGGLITAYRTAAQETLAAATIITKTEQSELMLAFDYDQMNTVMSVVKEFSLQVMQQDFHQTCTLKVRFPKSETSLIRAKFLHLSAVQVFH